MSRLLFTPTRTAGARPLLLAGADAGEQQGEAEAGEWEEGGGGGIEEEEEKEAGRRGAVVHAELASRELVCTAEERKEEPDLILLYHFTV